MTKFNSRTLSAMGMVLLVGCASSKSNGLAGDGDSAQARGGVSNGAGSSGVALSRGGTAGSSHTTLATSVGSTGSVGSDNLGTGASPGSSSGEQGEESSSGGSGQIGTGQAGAGANPSWVSAGMGFTTDPAPPSGGAGFTTDPPPAAGGSGFTTDPPPGDTVDPPPGDTVDPPPGDTVDPPPGDTVDPPPGDTPDPPPGDTPDPPAECTLTEIDKVNVIVFDDATLTGADTEGRMWVGGDFKSTMYSVNATTIKELKSTCDDWGLVVGGDINGNPLVKAGKVAYGGTLNGAAESACGVYNEKPVDFAALETKLDGYSAAFEAYPTNGTAVVSYSQMVLTGTDPTLNVFNIDGALLNTITNMKFVVPTTSSVIVNVSGEAINWQGGDFTLPDGGKACKNDTSAWCHRILYNMYEATSVTINGIGVQGSILAPYATFNGKGGNVDGQVIVKNLNGVTEYHPYFFNGCLLLPKAKS
jgi:choice-of-anchor A domain-containing protein